MIQDYRKEKTKYKTRCKCGAEIEWIAPFDMINEDVSDLVNEKFGWSLFPTRCPKCRETKEID